MPGGFSGHTLIKEILMHPVTNIHVVRLATVAMAATCLSMIVYVVSQLALS